MINTLDTNVGLYFKVNFRMEIMQSFDKIQLIVNTHGSLVDTFSVVRSNSENITLQIVDVSKEVCQYLVFQLGTKDQLIQI
jgi:hypothetical protein